MAVPLTFADAAALYPATLLAAKQASGLTVSVVIPAKNEESTVGGIVAAVRAAWCGEAGGIPLVDEVVVIDSDSTDATARVASEAGARVHAASAIRPDLGAARGKGEALWKSLFVTTGEVLLFLDADLIDWGPHFVSGLLAPFVHDPQVQLVKALYHRPLLGPDGAEAESGGRVTELVARPLIALHFPELAGLVQPLAGEWAIRRAAFEGYAVPVGYGVEIAALIDTVQRFGPGAIAQVGLGRRTHRHHRQDTLGLMAVQVMSAVEARLNLRSEVAATGTVPFTQYDHLPDGPVAGAFVPRRTDVAVAERPPAASV